MQIAALPPKLIERISVVGDHWIIDTWTNSAGYPYISWGGRDQPAYRVVYELLVGPVPSGLELDHLCVIPICCCPGHLEPVTHAENMRRIQDRQMKCRRAGHDWTNPRNVLVRPDGRRWCAECNRIDCRERYARQARARAALRAAG